MPSTAAASARYRQTENGKARRVEQERRRRLKTYGLTVDQYEAMAARQGGKCAVCGNLVTGRLHIDHRHYGDGAVRGLLCGPCNRALGVIEGWRFIPLLRYLYRNGDITDLFTADIFDEDAD